jgi:hypothetical protein
VAGLRRQVEQEILACQQMPHRRRVADIGDVDPHPLADVGDVGWVGAGFRDHRIGQHDLGAEPEETARQCRADKAGTPGNRHFCLLKDGKPRIRG